MEALPHPRQTERLQALYSYEILDTDREVEFDDVVQLVASICGTSIAVINLIDAERQWFKAEVGLGVRETPLATSLCSHVILEKDFVEIEDTLQDPRMADNPLCFGDQGLRFYAGALLKSDDGLPIGTLCVLDHKPMALTPLQRDAMRVIARQVMAQLDLRRSLRAQEILRREVDHRVKNSLESLSSLVRIQARSVESQEAKDALAAADLRIHSVMVLHEQLYRTDAGDAIDLKQYIGNLASYLRGLAPANVEVETDVDSVMVTSKQAAALGIFYNEFATNSFKHAFPAGRPGRVRFTLRLLPDGRISTRCSDDGQGLPHGGRADAGGLGMQVLEAIGLQLGSELHMSNDSNGVSASLEFYAHD